MRDPDRALLIREGVEDDVSALAAMINDFNMEEGSPGRVNEQDVTDLCFCLTSTYRVFVAEDGDCLIGYALLMRFFDTEPCAWCTYMQDLFIRPLHRSRGIGRRLMARVAEDIIATGGHELAWHVRDHNVRGRAFYASIGGQEATAVTVILGGDALRSLAAEA